MTTPRKDPSEYLPRGKAPGSGEISRERTTVHTIKYGTLWFRSQERLEQYQWTQNTRRAAVRAGWPHETQRELEAFDKRRKRYREVVAKRNAREAEIKARRQKLRDEHGLTNQNLMQLALAPGQEEVINMLEAEQDARDKLDMIKKMIEERTPITELMIRTSNIVGAKLEFK